MDVLTYLWVHGCPWWRSCPYCSSVVRATEAALQMLAGLPLNPDQRVCGGDLHTQDIQWEDEVPRREKYFSDSCLNQP